MLVSTCGSSLFQVGMHSPSEIVVSAFQACHCLSHALPLYQYVIIHTVHMVQQHARAITYKLKQAARLHGSLPTTGKLPAVNLSRELQMQWTAFARAAAHDGALSQNLHMHHTRIVRPCTLTAWTITV